jgi:hypothetical protein
MVRHDNDDVIDIDADMARTPCQRIGQWLAVGSGSSMGDGGTTLKRSTRGWCGGF